MSLSVARASSGDRRARRADAHHQRQPAGAARARAARAGVGGSTSRRYARSAKFAAITRWGKLDKVLEGIDAAKRAGLPIKLNVVALRGNDDESMT